MRVRQHLVLLAVSVTALTVSVSLPVGTSAGQFRNPLRKTTTIEKLACEIDILERHVEECGSVVTKQPDVWGQSRLTKFRQEYENQLFQQLGAFKETINATIRRSDQAFFASAMGLQAAAGGAAMPSTTNPLGPLIGDVNADKQTIFFRDAGQAVPGGTFVNDGTVAAGIALEPTVVLDQMSRYVNHLHELRRINTGDDTSASPGYALYMLRFPISVLPGKKTRQGFGAEVTISIDPYVSDELLPTTFRTLVINDVIDQLSMVATKALNNSGTMKLVNEYMKAVRKKAKLDADLKALQEAIHDAQQRGVADPRRDEMQAAATLATGAETALSSAMRDLKATWRPSVRLKPSRAALGIRNARLAIPPSYFADVFGCGAEMIGPILFDLWDSSERVDDCTEDERNNPCPGAQAAPKPKPMPTLSDCPAGRTEPCLHLTDIENMLDVELQAAYDFLSQEEAIPLWRHCSQELARTIRLHGRFDKNVRDDHTHRSVYAFRTAFLKEFSDLFPRAKHTATSCLAWAIIVEAALLNEQLVDDIRQTATAKNCACAITDWMQFYLPTTHAPFEARESFRQYVRCRWPVHAFAIDPIAQDQNVADSFSRRREMQLALSLGFASGQVGAQSFTRFARRLELDMDTIALNRTIIGFSHGNETIGWRFYPRVQTPDTESNATVFFRDLLWGGPSRDCEMRSWRLEPGVRECTALVMMPSFVPYVTYDTRSNWFSLVNPKKKQLDLRDAADLSRSVQSMRMAATACVRDAHLYRDGEVHRLLKAVDQVESRLPTQCAYVQVPIENTHGGFELIGTGVSGSILAPELRDWYGAPGVDVTADTELFLIGDNFSVHETMVIVGNKKLNVEILNRQTVKVLIPKGVRPIPKEAGKGDAVEARVATPYGVSAAVLIPVVAKSDSPAQTGFKWDPDAIVMYYDYDANGNFNMTGIELPDSKSVLIKTPANLNLMQVDLDLVLKTVKGVDVPDAKTSKISLTKVPFDNTKSTIGDDKSTASMIAQIQGKFTKYFKRSAGSADDVAVTATIKINAQGDGPTADNKLTIKLIERPQVEAITVPAPVPAPAPAPAPAATGPSLPKTSLRIKGHGPVGIPETMCAPVASGARISPAVDLARGNSLDAPRRPQVRLPNGRLASPWIATQLERSAPRPETADPAIEQVQYTESP